MNRGISKWLIHALACASIMTGVTLSAADAPVYDPTVVHYGDYIKLTCQLSSVKDTPSVYLALDDQQQVKGTDGILRKNDGYGQPVVTDIESPVCFWMVLPDNSKELDSVYGKEVAPDDKIRLEHVVIGGRLQVTPVVPGVLPTEIKRFVNDALKELPYPLSAKTYPLSNDSAPTDLIIHATGALKIGSFCELLPAVGNYLSVLPGHIVGVQTDMVAGSRLIVTTETAKNITWRVDDHYPVSQFTGMVGNESAAPLYTLVCYDQGDAKNLSVRNDAGKDVLSLETNYNDPKAQMVIVRNAQSRFFTLNSTDKYLTANNLEVLFSDQVITPQSEWVLVPDNSGQLKFMNRGSGGYLCRPFVLPGSVSNTEIASFWIKNKLWLSFDNAKLADFDQGLAVVPFAYKTLKNCVLDSDTADTMNYDPVQDSPFTPIFHPAWTLPVPKPGEANKIEFVVSIDAGTNDFDPRDLFIAFSGQPKLADDTIIIHMNENLFEVSTSYDASSAVAPLYIQHLLDEKDTSLNPRHKDIEAFGSLDKDGLMVTTRVAADKPTDTIKFVVYLYGPLLDNGAPRTDTFIKIRKLMATDAADQQSALFAKEKMAVQSNGAKYFGFGGRASKITIKDIKVNDTLVSKTAQTQAPESLINLSSTYKANPGDVLIERVTVGSRPVTVGTEVKGAYVAWAIGDKESSSYTSKLFEWKIAANGVGSWAAHDAQLLAADGTKTPLSGFTDISASSDGRLFAVANNKLYQYTWPADALTNGTWSLYPTKGINGEDLSIQQVAVGRLKTVTVESKSADGKTVQNPQRFSALFVVAKDGNGVRVYQSTDATDLNTPWVSRSVQADSIARLCVSSYDLTMALNGYGKAYCLTHLGKANDNSWEPLYDKLILKTKNADGTVTTVKQNDLKLLDMAVAGPDLIYGVTVDMPPARPYRLLVRYSSADQGWIPVADEQGKDMSGMLSVSLNEAGSFMFVDDTGKSYRSEEMGVTFLVKTPSGASVPAPTAGTPPPPSGSPVDTKTVVDQSKVVADPAQLPKDVAITPDSSAKTPQSNTRGRPLTRLGKTSGLGVRGQSKNNNQRPTGTPGGARKPAVQRGGRTSNNITKNTQEKINNAPPSNERPAVGGRKKPAARPPKNQSSGSSKGDSRKPTGQQKSSGNARVASKSRQPNASPRQPNTQQKRGARK